MAETGSSSSSTKPNVKVLCFWPSPFSQRVELALTWKGIPYERIEENVYVKSPLLLASSPIYKKVPVLIHGSLPPLCESSVILQYIDEAWPLPHRNLLPSDTHARAVSRFWADYIDKKLLDAMWAIVKTAGEEQKEAIKVAKECVKKVEALLEEMSMVASGKGGPFFGGEETGYVDIMLGPFVVWRKTVEEAGEVDFEWEEKHPRMLRWIKAFQNTDIAMAVLPDPEKLKDYALNVLRKRHVTKMEWSQVLHALEVYYHPQAFN